MNTIAAIATAMSSSGIGIVRISGDEAFTIIDKIYRGKGKNSYDLIMGPVANDQLYATIRLYEQGVVTADAAIEMLKTHKLFNQLSFHTVKVIPLLKFTESIEV